jgi:uncharacterized membrane protein HdeD (DUF308 family)
MKIKISRHWLAIVMLIMGLIFVFSIFEQGDILFGILCLFLIVNGIWIHYTVVQTGDCSDYDVIG